MIENWHLRAGVRSDITITTFAARLVSKEHYGWRNGMVELEQWTSESTLTFFRQQTSLKVSLMNSN